MNLEDTNVTRVKEPIPSISTDPTASQVQIEIVLRNIDAKVDSLCKMIDIYNVDCYL